MRFYSYVVYSLSLDIVPTCIIDMRSVSILPTRWKHKPIPHMAGCTEPTKTKSVSLISIDISNLLLH